jgi:hypothetical protein
MERILCAAICNPDQKDMAGEPLIYCGFRHCNILWQSIDVSRNPFHQGFLTNKGRFINRMEAASIAIKAKQVKKLDSYELYSEDLY